MATKVGQAAAARTPPSFLSRIFPMLLPKGEGKPASLRVSRPPRKLELERIIVRRFDEDGDGKMSPAELRKCVRAAVGEELTAEEAETAVEVADWDGDGLLGVEDLARFAGGEGEEEKGRNLREAFRVYEMEGEGRITPRSLRAALGRMGERRTEEDCEAMIRRFDIDGDGFLSFDEFKVMLL